MKRICVFCGREFEDERTTSSEYNSKYGICPVCREKMLKKVRK